jgi:phage N-6-adenine-methyltransferase
MNKNDIVEALNVSMNEATRQVLHSSKSNDWGTPKALFDEWNERWGPFNLDPCTSPDNPLGTKYFFTEKDNGLVQDWSKFGLFIRFFMNPPYGREGSKWVLKAHEETQHHFIQGVALLPSRTGTRWFQNIILPNYEIIFLPGRIRFVGARDPAPFDSMLVIFR